MSITIAQAQKGIAAGLAKAGELKSPSSIAILDEGRNLIAFARMDGALLASIELSRSKAFTARSLNMKTGDVMQYVQPGAALYGMHTSHQPPFVVFGGGEPIKRRDQVIGAVGVAGGMVPDDEAIASAVAEAIALA
ncbi:heme-binding protein [Ramlibacter sp. WS9]|uniref:GlcG/HbpS family heme-binding protein n=1 Tax=Ramlibacter sp. WS9 TaxID=1882741 RepID=UPI00114344BC|nr:heme-binding protein [Ramlibacter sp. WS9]ROZ75006.1 heme-binding protein [Ramlibacter sp. WS9]